MKKDYTPEQLAIIQIENEINMKTAGIERFHMNNERAISNGSASDTNWNRRIIQELIEPMALAIDAYLDYYKGRRGKPSKTLTYLRSLPSTQASYITIKNVLDSLTRETKARDVAKRVGQRIEDQVRFSGISESAPRYIEKVKLSLRQNNSAKYKHQSAVMSHAGDTLMRGDKDKGFEPKPELRWLKWPEQDLLQLGSQLVNIFADNILFNGNPVICKRTVVKNKKKDSYLAPTEHMEAWIEEYKEVMESMSPAFAPCVVPPKRWSTPFDGGYYISEVAETLPMVKCRRTQLYRLTYEQMPEVYDAINALQNVAWQINDDVMDVARQIISLSLPLGLPSKEPIEMPVCPIGEEYEELSGLDLKDVMSKEEWEDFLLWKHDKTEAHKKENKRKADFVKIQRILGSASQYQDFKEIYFVYTADFRGRIYSRSDSVSPQGNDIQKGLIKFAEGKALGSQGYYWFCVHGANIWGEDKVTFDERVQFIEAMTDQIRDIAADPISFTEWAGADKPFQFLAWCFEYAEMMDFIENGNNREDFVSYIPVAMDGSCSGIQHYSAILRDSIGGKAVNLTPSDKPNDIYSDVAKVALLKMHEDAAELYGGLVADKEAEHRAKIAEGWIMVGIDRKITKSPVMTLPYGSTQIRCLDTISDHLQDMQKKEDALARAQNRPAARVHPFALNRKEDGVPRFEAEKYASSVIWNSIGDVVVAAREGMKFIQTVARDLAIAGKHLEAVSPTGFIMEMRELDYTSRRVKTQLLGETFMSLKEELLTYNVRKMKSGSAPNFIHMCDASHLIKVVNAAKDQGINSIAVIHDSFGTHACDTPVLRKALVDTFVDMYTENDVLEDFIEHNEALHCMEINVPLPSKGDLDIEEVRKSKYCFG